MLSPFNLPTHSVTMANLLLVMDKTTSCIEEHENVLSADDKENLVFSLGSLAHQAEMIGYVELIPNPTREQRQMLAKLQEDASKMINLTEMVLSSLSLH